MYCFPKRVSQHKNETKALAIFLYHMRNFGGIIRDLRENDYGIDLEYEFVSGENVVGRFLKIQLKGFERVSSSNPKISNLKQSTLNYWAELSYRVNTIVVGVDVVRERIYFTFPLFWDTISGINNTNKRKSISFAKMGRSSAKAKIDDLNQAAAILIHHMALIPTVGELLLRHKSVLGRINEIIELCSACLYNDQFLEFEEFDELKRLLDDASALLWRWDLKKRSEETEKKYSWHSLEFFRAGTRDGTLKYCDMKDKLNPIVVSLFRELASLRTKTLDGFCYWLVKDRDYLELVYKHDVSVLLGENIEEIIKNYGAGSDTYVAKDYNAFVTARINALEGERR
jgi:hypothetical protein